MTEAILFFTFSPVQSFIREARRAEDLFNGSQMLSEMAKAVVQSIGQHKVIYPQMRSFERGVPNMIVAKVDNSQVQKIAVDAENALYQCWKSFVESAFLSTEMIKFEKDDYWLSIWEQQTNPKNIWQIFWTTAPITQNYSQAYKDASQALDAVKRSRIFNQVKEPGQKDSLSGKRTALTKKGIKAKQYWSESVEALVRSEILKPSEVRPEGKERLDAIGAVKRFYTHNGQSFLSTSTVASEDFLQNLKTNHGTLLETYRKAVDDLFKDNELFKIRKEDGFWPFDGDLFYSETFTPSRLKEDYYLSPNAYDPYQLQKCLDLQREMEKVGKVGLSKYYAIIVFDGDQMGKNIDLLLEKPDAEAQHRNFSQLVGDFAEEVEGIIKKHLGFLVYNGGDDVMCMAPIRKAFPLTKNLYERFQQITGKKASAGIAITHHHSPLDYALDLARDAEKEAKDQAGRDAVCIKLYKRSGEPLTVRSKWEYAEHFSEFVDGFASDQLSNRFPYRLEENAPVLASLSKEAAEGQVRFLLSRHTNLDTNNSNFESLVTKITDWAEQLNYLHTNNGQLVGFLEVTNWLILARFIASGGGE